MTTGENNMEKNLEIKEILEEIKDMLIKSIDPKPEDEMEKSEDCNCETCKSNDTKCEDCPKCSEEMSKSYESDNEDEDKWNNMEKACWSGYEQQGMKDKGGRKVPNCVPIKKSADEAPINEAEKEVKKSIWGGAFLK
jgi:hypothetical protein